MNETSMRAAEQTTLALRRAGARTIAFAAPEPGSGTSAVAALAAAVLARSGQPTLLMDLSRTIHPVVRRGFQARERRRSRPPTVKPSSPVSWCRPALR
jgi:Mrp family chromosome partitioning ATPase